jgi:hypothetical protein
MTIEQQVQGTTMKVRAAGVAGSFYPADAAALISMMDQMLAQARPAETSGTILAAVAPHAGFIYSGPVAAHTYAALRGHKYERVVVIAPSHFEAFDFTSVYDGDSYQTSLGTVDVDKVFAGKLKQMDPSIRLSEDGHTATARGAEHALEVQLPWLQHVLGDFALVPIIMGNHSYESSRALGVSLSKLIETDDENKPTLIVASSDLSHYHPYDEAVATDRKSLDALAAWDYYSMARNFETRHWEACGGAPIVAAMIAAERLGAREATVLRYANSGDTSGDHQRVVGYGSALFVKANDGMKTEASFALTDAEKRELLTLARRSVEHAVREGKPLEPKSSHSAALQEERGAFVTLKIAGSLRGCIGYTSATKPLYLTIRDTATLAALRDPRFPPVTASELSKLEYEISVLSPLRRVTDLGQIKIGEHGLLMKNGRHEGLLLPQVPLEWNWDRTTFLEQTSVKAGMSREHWKDENTDIFAFSAVVFGENEEAVAE